MRAVDSEADTCRKYIVPKLHDAGWNDDLINEQRTITDGRIVVAGDKVRRKKSGRVDYLLRIARDFSMAVVEAKASYKKPADGLQQAKDYAQMLGLKFAFSSNGLGIVEFDFLTGQIAERADFPSPTELWTRLRKSQGPTDDAAATRLLTPGSRVQGKQPRYYQEIAVNRVVQAMLQGQRRVLLTMATGTGKTFVAFQIIWKLWNSRWNARGDHRKPRVLYLADRNFLVDVPKDREFAVFEDARHKIESGQIVKSREIYFAIYQAIAQDERRSGLYKEFTRDFFDLIVVDECHRGSAKDESNWRDILEHFQPAYQLGMTATPLRDDNVDTYGYFENPVYTYSLKQGIEDGFLAPYKVRRIVTTADAVGWRPKPGEIDRDGRPIPDQVYQTPEFDRLLALKPRTEAIARHLTDHLRQTNRYDKTIVFCVDQEHALEMMKALTNLNADLAQRHADYVVRITSDEEEIGRGHLDRFSDVEKTTPVIVTTSKLLTTGVDVPTCKNIVIARVVNSMTEFKQIIGRGTRVRDDYGKYYFTILDYTGSATRLFADPVFDGEPALLTEEGIDGQGRVTSPPREPEPAEEYESRESQDEFVDDSPTDCSFPGPAGGERRKFHVDQGYVEIAADVAYEMDEHGNQLKATKYTDYTMEQVRSMFSSAAELRSKWTRAEERSRIIDALAERGITIERLAEVAGQHDADPFDLLCNVAYSLPLRSRRERAEQVRKGNTDFLGRYTKEAREILNLLLDKYIEHGVAEFRIPDILKVSPLSSHGNIIEIAARFGGTDKLREAVAELQSLLYAA
ncbi:MAG: DEAD/DEAH box helicase family protein [Nitrospirae bacterium]|nr:DEAD/DEAH box helicase family protein [Nitrospirota bacterium]